MNILFGYGKEEIPLILEDNIQVLDGERFEDFSFNLKDFLEKIDFKENKLTSFEIQPEKVEIKIARGGKRISNFKIINHSSRTLNLKIYLSNRYYLNKFTIFSN